MLRTKKARWTLWKASYFRLHCTKDPEKALGNLTLLQCERDSFYENAHIRDVSQVREVRDVRRVQVVDRGVCSLASFYDVGDPVKQNQCNFLTSQDMDNEDNGKVIQALIKQHEFQQDVDETVVYLESLCSIGNNQFTQTLHKHSTL